MPRGTFLSTTIARRRKPRLSKAAILKADSEIDGIAKTVRKQLVVDPGQAAKIRRSK